MELSFLGSDMKFLSTKSITRTVCVRVRKQMHRSRAMQHHCRASVTQSKLLNAYPCLHAQNSSQATTEQESFKGSILAN